MIYTSAKIPAFSEVHPISPIVTVQAIHHLDYITGSYNQKPSQKLMVSPKYTKKTLNALLEYVNISDKGL